VRKDVGIRFEGRDGDIILRSTTVWALLAFLSDTSLADLVLRCGGGLDEPAGGGPEGLF